jgi:dTDP-glucose pyrophosphorylase/predicted transcriptional regulator
VTADERALRLKSTLISPRETISAAIRRLDDAGTGVLLVCGEDGRLFGVLTDGDIRRAMLRGVSFDVPCESIACQMPVVAPPDVPAMEALRLMNEADVNQLPLVDPGDGRVVDLLLRRDLMTEKELAVAAVVMAGGFGTRLRPLTDDLPKPMLRVGDRPLLERTIEQLRNAGIRRVNVTTHYLPEKITDHFGDGHDYGVEIAYVTEDRPLGTAGGLALVKDSPEPLLVINGDILASIDFRDLARYHRKQQADVTVCVRRHQIPIPYGVMDCEGLRLVRIREKPSVDLLVNAGIYLIEPSVRDFIPNGERFDMTDLLHRLLAAGRPVATYPIIGYWLDVGRPEDFERAQEDVKKEGLR